MKFSERCVIEADRQRVWEFLEDAEKVARCMEGVQAFDPIDDDHFRGVLRVKLGPVALSFEGTLKVEIRDPEQARMLLQADARDRKRGGRLRARLALQLAELTGGRTQMHVDLDTTLQGKLSELGQPLIRRKTQVLLRNFAERVSEELAELRVLEGP
ncbi:MAG: SRPBCC family protein [Myxococcota bacterium]